MRHRTVTALAAAVAMVSVVGWFGIKGTGTANAIANGELVAEGKFTFSVKLIMRGIPKPDGTKRSSACSGALIAPQWVITAGHCFRDENNIRVERPVADSTIAYIGRNNIDNTSIGHEANVIAVRQAAPDVDMSLAKLDTPITDIAPLAISDVPPEVGTILRLTGFGAVFGDVNTDVDFEEKNLRTGTMRVTGVQPTELTATGDGPQRDTTPCPYDSGAPFFTEGEDGVPLLIGLDSDGPSCPHSEDEILGRVENQKAFIESVITAEG